MGIGRPRSGPVLPVTLCDPGLVPPLLWASGGSPVRRSTLPLSHFQLNSLRFGVYTAPRIQGDGQTGDCHPTAAVHCSVLAEGSGTRSLHPGHMRPSAHTGLPCPTPLSTEQCQDALAETWFLRQPEDVHQGSRTLGGLTWKADSPDARLLVPSNCLSLFALRLSVPDP